MSVATSQNFARESDPDNTQQPIFLPHLLPLQPPLLLCILYSTTLTTMPLTATSPHLSALHDTTVTFLHLCHHLPCCCPPAPLRPRLPRVTTTVVFLCFGASSTLSHHHHQNTCNDMIISEFSNTKRQMQHLCNGLEDCQH